MPWDGSDDPIPRPWTDSDDVRAAEWLQHRELNVTPMTVSRSVGAMAREITVHPVRDHLGALAWDGVPRIETWACRYLGAEDTAFNRSVGALWLISAVARIFRPGVKADHMLVLEGPQGARKSTALKVLAGEDWFTDELPDLGSKDAAMHMQGVWIIEIAELDAIGKAEVSRIKAFLTRTTDRFRPPYGRYTIEVPRQCVFAGTVNPDTYLRDETGNRRFWPVRCGTIDIDALARDRDQLWAEAVARFRAGAIWWLDTPELIEAASAEQEKRYQADAWDELIERWLTHEVRTVPGEGFSYAPSRKESVPETCATDQRLGWRNPEPGNRTGAGTLDPGGADAGFRLPEEERLAAATRGGWTRRGARMALQARSVVTGGGRNTYRLDCCRRPFARTASNDGLDSEIIPRAHCRPSPADRQWQIASVVFVNPTNFVRIIRLAECQHKQNLRLLRRQIVCRCIVIVPGLSRETSRVASVGNDHDRSVFHRGLQGRALSSVRGASCERCHHEAFGAIRHGSIDKGRARIHVGIEDFHLRQVCCRLDPLEIELAFDRMTSGWCTIVNGFSTADDAKRAGIERLPSIDAADDVLGDLARGMNQLVRNQDDTFASSLRVGGCDQTIDEVTARVFTPRGSLPLGGGNDDRLVSGCDEIEEIRHVLGGI